jgi:hypothetical protein
MLETDVAYRDGKDTEQGFRCRTLGEAAGICESQP